MAQGHKRSRRHPVISLRMIGAVVLTAVVLGVFALDALGVSLPGWSEKLSVRAFRELILSWGPWGVAAAIGLMVLHSFVPFPAEFVAFANGMCFGLLWGMVITWAGAMIGAFLSFALARWLGRPFVERAARRGEMRRLDDWLARQGGHAVFLGRFLPVISFNLINYAAGLMRISWWTFAWATGLGILPMTALMVVLGERYETLSWWSWLLILAAGPVLWLVARRALPR
ncbi:MAG: TVP38/TMEM64 family protein [Alphaproteobacteria bacterium]